MIRKRILILGVLMCIVGIVGAIASQLQKPKFKVTQSWMESKAPAEVGGFSSIASAPADQATLDALQPYGIVDRDYIKEGKRFNVMLLASDRRESFHSPNVCLPAQGLNITNEHDETVQTRTHGAIRVTIAELTLQSAPADKQYMAFLYRVQNRFLARSGNTTLVLTLAMFAGPIRGNFDQDTVFYRFITENSKASEEELRSFVANFLDTAHDTSGGFF
ncbi:MAG TPA: exosortase-associated EpsI family protein [Fimbriimonadaceae bacterium]|nr:exosortase-associated EpsI family protein [Fimbriimonadaceae bacterium]